ncbi:MAG TPA: deoxyguanosinetriphosphate triphosphohydrolase [Kiritimatiellia bacterium]|nr:deoxyguanosinetriphosphate triphosphohydrolase [Kiritimatiellia bacterium]
MLRPRLEIVQRETSGLADYACTPDRSRGRPVPEPQHPYRTDYQRDRDRIIHSRCFRRLEYKTQVFVNGTADHYRTRLTHTIEVAAVSRTLARALALHEDLAETISLAHDIGHSPFGHMGERALDELMTDHGGFDHNLQSLRWVEELETRYPDRPGFNLTWEVRAGLRKHLSKTPGEQLDGFPIGPHQILEAQIADVADDLTYYAHDIDDGLDAGLITTAQLMHIEIWRDACERCRREFTALDPDLETPMILRSLLDLQVEDVLQRSEAMINQYHPHSPWEAMDCPERIVDFSPELRAKLKPLREFLFTNVYWHPTVHHENEIAVEMMKTLFHHYVNHPETMGRKARARIPSHGLWRTACDYVSGMTDRYALDEYRRFVQP